MHKQKNNKWTVMVISKTIHQHWIIFIKYKLEKHTKHWHQDSHLSGYLFGKQWHNS